MNLSIEQIIKFSVKEQFIQDIDNTYSNTEQIPIYNIDIITNYGSFTLLNKRLVDITLISETIVQYRFISMNQYSRRNYCKNTANVDIQFDMNNNTIKFIYVSFLGKIREENGKYVESRTFIINNEVKPFFFYLYKKFKNMNKMPLARL